MAETTTPVTIGFDRFLYSDCLIKSKKGVLYYTTKAAIAGCSEELRVLVQDCIPTATSHAKEEAKFKSWARTSEDSITMEVLEVPLPDPDEQIKALVEHLHRPDLFLVSVAPNVTKEGAVKISHLVPIAHKYNIQGNSIWILKFVVCVFINSSLSDLLPHGHQVK